MKISSRFKKGILGTIIIPALVLCTPTSNNKNKQISINSPILIENKLELKVDNNTKVISWKNIEDYDTFVKSKVNEFYASDIKEIYNFYNIKRDLPKYGFKAKEEEFICLDCEGATYLEDKDSIYFYSSCSEETFKDYTKYLKEKVQQTTDDFINRLHYFIKHEAAHAFYYDLGKQLGANYLFNINQDKMSKLEKIQNNLVKEGVAEYMSNRGEEKEWPPVNDADFKKMIEEKNDYYIYGLGFRLVKPILDLNFQKGIEELIAHPLTKEDLNNLLGYRDKRIENILKKTQN